jgi:hypothetical protein
LLSSFCNSLCMVSSSWSVMLSFPISLIAKIASLLILPFNASFFGLAFLNKMVLLPTCYRKTNM